jgi:putative ABC transport system ATP-binding protein
MAASDLVIETIQLDRTFQNGPERIHAVTDVDFQVERGEFTAIVGPSGSGKTTLLNLLGGLDSPTDGEVRVLGTDLGALKANQRVDFRLRHIGFVFQAYNLIPVLCAQENVEFTMLLQGVPAQERRRRSSALLEAVGLTAEADRRPAKLSGGQQQRVAVARALASQPAFVLADEPTANLDSKSASALLDIMAQLNQSEGTTFLFSTHDQRVIDRARRVVTLVDGRIDSDLRRDADETPHSKRKTDRKTEGNTDGNTDSRAGQNPEQA